MNQEPANDLIVAAGERNRVRLFTLDLPREQIRFVRDEDGALADLLGVPDLDRSQADIIRIADLGDLGLTGYLTEGMGIEPGELDRDRSMLDGLNGHILALRSRAFRDAVRIAPAAGVRLLRVYGEPGIDWSGAAPVSASARPGASLQGQTSPRAHRARSRRIGATVFAIFMALLALVLWAVLS